MITLVSESVGKAHFEQLISQDNNKLRNQRQPFYYSAFLIVEYLSEFLEILALVDVLTC